MTSMPEHSMLSGTDDPDQPPGYPFRGPGLLVRVAPFAAIAVLAEASLALPPRPQSGASAAVSLVLLLAVAAAFALPWPPRPPFLAVLVPLAYCGSVLALILSMGATSGIGLVILVPLIWTALYQRRWESACVVVAIAAVELIISLTPVTAPGDVIARRVILWTALSTVIAFAAHELRDRLHRSRQEAARLQAGLTELTVLKDRDRIAADLQDKVIQQVFAAGLDLQGTALRANQPEVRERILASADDLDQVIRLIRNTIFGLDEQPQGRGLHAELRNVFSRLPAATEISFTGPVYGALDPVRATRLVQTLKDALEVISSYSTPARVAITTSDTAYVTEIETTSAVLGADEEFPPWVAGLTRSTSQTGISLSITPAPGRTRFAWSILLAGPAGQAPQPE